MEHERLKTHTWKLGRLFYRLRRLKYTNVQIEALSGYDRETVGEYYNAYVRFLQKGGKQLGGIYNKDYYWPDELADIAISRLGYLKKAGPPEAVIHLYENLIQFMIDNIRKLDVELLLTPEKKCGTVVHTEGGNNED